MKMKAYTLGLYSNDDAGNELVFARTAKEAKKLVKDLDPESYIDLYATRCPAFDGMENATNRELYLKMWHEGWSFHQGGCPFCGDDNVTDGTFLEWYDKTYKD